MAEILPEAAEYATVERLSDMLSELREPYRVTAAYAFFSTILCWVMQRVRTPDGDAAINDDLARQAGRRLLEQPIQGVPWNIPDESFQGISAFVFMRALRNAVAHGDARSIEPVNRNGILIGHRFRCRPEGHGTLQIELHREDFQRLGVALADLYCEAMRAVMPEDERLPEIAHVLREEAA